MNIWEAKYKALSAHITDDNLINNAEKLVRIACDISSTTVQPLGTVIYNMLGIIDRPKKITAKNLSTSKIEFEGEAKTLLTRY